MLLFPLPLEIYLSRSYCGQSQRGCCLCSPLRFWIYFCVWYKWSSFSLLHVAVQFSQHHLLKRLSLFRWISFLALSKINWPYSCGSISRFSILSIDLCVCFYASTILFWWLQLCYITWSLELWYLHFCFSFSGLLWLSGSFVVPYKF